MLLVAGALLARCTLLCLPDLRGLHRAPAPALAACRHGAQERTRGLSTRLRVSRRLASEFDDCAG